MVFSRTGSNLLCSPYCIRVCSSDFSWIFAIEECLFSWLPLFNLMHTDLYMYIYNFYLFIKAVLQVLPCTCIQIACYIKYFMRKPVVKIFVQV